MVMWNPLPFGEESHEVKRRTLLTEDDFNYPNVSPLRWAFRSNQNLSFNKMMSIQAYVLLSVALLQCHCKAEWRKTTFLTLILSRLEHRHLKLEKRIILVSLRGRRRESSLSLAGGGRLQLPARLRLGRDLRHGLHQQLKEGEDYPILHWWHSRLSSWTARC